MFIIKIKEKYTLQLKQNLQQQNQISTLDDFSLLDFCHHFS